MNLYPVAIVENFYENPDAMRKFALAQQYEFIKDKKMPIMYIPAVEPKTSLI